MILVASQAGNPPSVAPPSPPPVIPRVAWPKLNLSDSWNEVTSVLTKNWTLLAEDGTEASSGIGGGGGGGGAEIVEVDAFSLFNNTNATNTTRGLEDDAELNVVLVVATSVILGLTILITVIGNVFVIAAILLERNLQNVANYLIVSLAVADLMVACLVMPLGAVYQISQGWILGPELCDMWTSSDVLCCTASILHLVAIAVDRYWAVTQVDYIHTRNSSRIGTMILLVWAVALVVSLAPQFGWKDAEYLKRIKEQQICLPSQDVAYQIFATFSTFYVPLLVILGLYWKIFQTARKRIHKRRALKSNVVQENDKDRSSSGGHGGFLSRRPFFRLERCPSSEAEKSTVAGENLVSSLVLAEGHSTTSVLEDIPDLRRRSTEGSGSEPQSTTAFTISGPNTSPDKSPTANNGSVAGDITLLQQTNKGSPAPATPTPASSAAAAAVARKEKKESLEAKRERKAAKTLAIITGAFVVCWLPFFILALVMPLCTDCEISVHMLSFFLWLGYFNSTLNPVIYTIFSPEFRQAFKRILYGGGHGARRRRRDAAGTARDFRR